MLRLKWCLKDLVHELNKAEIGSNYYFWLIRKIVALNS